MSSKADGQTLIDAFFAALSLRNLEECQQRLAQLRRLSVEQTTYRPWCAYLTGILANEQKRDWAEAQQIFSSLLRDDLDPSLRGRVLLALGRTYEYQGRWTEAIDTYELSLPIFVEMKRVADQIKVWKQMAFSCYRGFTQGDFDAAVLQQAVEYCQLALAAFESIPQPLAEDELWLKGSVWNTLGLIDVSLRRLNEALTCYQQDLAICQALNDRHGMGLSYGNLGEVYQKQGRWTEALAAYQQALNLIREFDNHYDEIEALANLAFLHQQKGQRASALDYYSQAIQAIEALRADISSEAAQAGFFATVVDTYANMVLLCLAEGHRAWAFEIVEKARSRAFLDTLAARSPHLSQVVETATITLAELQTALPADALLLEYFTTGLLEIQEGQSAGTAERHRFPPEKTLIFAVTRDQLQVHLVPLSPNDLRPGQLDSIVERHFLDPEIRRMLYDRLIAPVEPLLQGKRRLYIAPHGPLHYIPFQALAAPDGDTLLREDSPPITYAPSATLLFRHSRVPSGRASKSCLSLGYNSQGQTLLYFAEDEARRIAQLTEGQAMVGSQPKMNLLYRQAPDYRLLHLACHGEFNPTSPLASFLELAPDEKLTALDVLEHLHLQTDLVTLSACESGLSRVRRGDELVGFSRAFFYAGAPALVSSLWRVNDQSTRILIEKFYQEIQAGVGFAEALKRAQLWIKHLSYQQVLDLLPSPAEDGASMTPNFVLSEQLPDLARTSRNEPSLYLRGAAVVNGPDEIDLDGSEPGPDDKVFEDPYYWAAFVLIGDPEA